MCSRGKLRILGSNLRLKFVRHLAHPLSQSPARGWGGDRTRDLLHATQARSQRELHPQNVANGRLEDTIGDPSSAIVFIVLESLVRIELTSNGGKNPAPYQSRHRPRCLTAKWRRLNARFAKAALSQIALVEVYDGIPALGLGLV